MNTISDQNNNQLDLLEELNNRLGVIISLLFRILPQDKPSISVKEQVEILNNLGLRPKDIAAILGRTHGHVNKELAGIRKATRKGDSSE